MSRIGAIIPLHLARARKYRSSGNWQKCVALQKSEFPLCCDPHGDHLKEGITVPMAQVHHVLGLATHFHLRAYPKNLRSLCVKCHHKIEMMERSGRNTAFLFKITPEC